MAINCFSYLEKDFPSIYSECENCEKHLVENNFVDSIVRAGKACELISKDVASNAGYDELNDKNQENRVEILKRKMIIPDNYARDFHFIRRQRNIAAHQSNDSLGDLCYQIHRRLFNVCTWFYENYGLDDFIPPEYNGPIYVSDKIDREEIDSIVSDNVEKSKNDLKEYIQDNIEQSKENIMEYIKNQVSQGIASELENHKTNLTIEEDIDNLEDYPFKKKNGSYLFNELSKLNISSGEAVENENNLNPFKDYIHVNRSIQDEFIQELERVVNDEQSHLIMLCGSVGDGKSHLLAYLKTNRPDLYNKFTIHGDATESHHTNKNAEDTLADVLSSFDDENIDNSFEKFILAINLGVLNNFLESKYCDERYTKLKEIITNAHIFDSDIISQNIIQDKVSFITFSDYNLFELNGDYDSNYVSSDYISSLIGKITDADYYNNPFYRAYAKDKEIGYIHPIIYNYEILSDPDVQKIIIEYIIRVFVEYKKIISTRDLLNFIYELIVPSEFIEYSMNSGLSDFVEDLLPNMLFKNADRSDLLNLLSQYDPTLIRSEKIDDFIIKFNIYPNLCDIMNEYFDMSRLSFLKDYLSAYEDLLDCSPSEKQNLIIILIRFALFYGKSNFKNAFADKNYLKYLKYLYAYNIQNHSQYQDLFLEVKKAIFNYKGSIRKDYICIDELESFKVSKELKLKYSPDIFDVVGDTLSNRFKTSIKVYFYMQSSRNKIPLEIDYPLYSTVCKLNEGYKPNKLEKENLILFEEFINNLINESASDILIVKNIDLDVNFTFEYNEDFDSFLFERGG